MPYLKQHQHTENFMEILLHKHEKYRPIVAILDNIVRNAKQLNWLDFEEIAVKISNINCSGFCTDIHRGTRDALKQKNQLSLNKNIDALITFSLKLNASPKEITNHDIQTLRNRGWDDQSIEDIIAWVASVNLYNTMANGLGFSNNLPDEVFNAMGKGTIEQGSYLSIFDYFSSLEAE